MAALPLQPARAVAGDEPQRRAVVVRGADPLALGVEREPGHRGGMRQLAQFPAVGVEQMDQLADAAGDQALAALGGMARHLLHPFHAERAEVADGPVSEHPARTAVVAARDEASWHRVGRQRERRAVMHRDLPPGLRLGGIDQPQRAVAEREGEAAPGPVEARGDHEGAEVATRPALLDQEARGARLAHPVRLPGRLRSRGAGAGGSGCGR